MAKARFEWDPKKDRENREKHGVSFAEAQFAFADPRRALAGLGRASSRCALRTEMMLFASSGQAIGGKASKSMSAKIKYTDEPVGRLKVVPDFLPRPEDLVFQDEGVKVTIALSKRSVEFFKTEAKRHNTQYQRMIRRLLDAYAEHHSRPLTTGSRRTQKRAA